MLHAVACAPSAPPAPPPQRPAFFPTDLVQHPERWHRLPQAEKTEAMQALEAIGYVQGSTPAPAQSGVTRHQPERCAEGWNLYTSGHAPEAILMDQRGNVGHVWRRAFLDVWPELADRPRQPQMEYWRRVHLLPGGALLAIFDGIGLIKLDHGSRVLWQSLNQAHHDLDVAPNGDILVLTRDAHLIPRLHPTQPVLEDYIAVLDAQGREKQRVSILECLENSLFADRLAPCRGRSGDLFHTNTLEILDDRAQRNAPEFQPGRILVSIRELDLLAVLDLQEKRACWVFQEQFRRQHEPTLLDNGNLLLFDNQGPGNGQSAVVEFELPGMRRAWTYPAQPTPNFYTETCGLAQRLPNGNTLLLESDRGRALEITPGGDTVWEFHNPHRAGEQREYIATLFFLRRLPQPDWLNPVKTAP